MAINVARPGAGALTCNANYDIIEAALEISENSLESETITCQVSQAQYKAQQQASIQAGSNEKAGIQQEAYGLFASASATGGGLGISMVHSSYANRSSDSLWNKMPGCSKPGPGDIAPLTDSSTRTKAWVDEIAKKPASEVHLGDDVVQFQNRSGDQVTLSKQERDAWVKDMQGRMRDTENPSDLEGTYRATGATNKEILEAMPDNELDELKDRAQKCEKTYKKDLQNAQTSVENTRQMFTTFGQMAAQTGQGVFGMLRATEVQNQRNEEARRAALQSAISTSDSLTQSFGKYYDNSQSQLQGAQQAAVQIMQASHA